MAKAVSKSLKITPARSAGESVRGYGALQVFERLRNEIHGCRSCDVSGQLRQGRSAQTFDRSGAERYESRRPSAQAARLVRAVHGIDEDVAAPSIDEARAQADRLIRLQSVVRPVPRRDIAEHEPVDAEQPRHCLGVSHGDLAIFLTRPISATFVDA